MQDSLLQWRRQHNLVTFRPEEVLQLPAVLTQVNPRWSVQKTGVNKKLLVLEGFSVCDEWADLDRVRPWSNGWSTTRDTNWLDGYNKEQMKKKSTATVQANGGAG
jgi:hypothetical protein